MKLRLTVDGKPYEVEVEVMEDERPQRGSGPSVVQSSSAGPVQVSSQAPPPTSQSTTSDESKVLRSPISGVVVRVPAQAGQEVKTNAPLMVLEAMKNGDRHHLSV